MYFKVEKGTETYNKLRSVCDKITDCNNKALDLTKELGFNRCCKDRNGVGGGISALESLSGKPEGYKVVGEKYQDLYYPKVKNKEVVSKIESLPVVSYDEFNGTIGFSEQFTDMTFHHAFGLKDIDESFLITISDECDYKPKSDMIEILASEYKELSK